MHASSGRCDDAKNVGINADVAAVVDVDVDVDVGADLYRNGLLCTNARCSTSGVTGVVGLVPNPFLPSDYAATAAAAATTDVGNKDVGDAAASSNDDAADVANSALVCVLCGHAHALSRDSLLERLREAAALPAAPSLTAFAALLHPGHWTLTHGRLTTRCSKSFVAHRTSSTLCKADLM
jgi:hypothetical protein